MAQNDTFPLTRDTWLPRPEVSYVAIALLLGVLLALVSPPSATPDEPAHLGRAVAIAQGILVERSTGELGPAYLTIFDGLSLDIRRKANSLTPRRTLDVLRRPLQCALIPQAVHGASAYPPLPYVVQSIVWRISCASGSSVGAFLFGARIANLILATLITACAIRLMPFGKWALFTLALLPMTLSQSASLSADSLTNAVVFLWAAFLARLLTSEEAVSGRERLMGAVLALSLVFCKPGYPLLLLPAALVSRARFPSQAARLRFVATVVGIPLICVVVWAQVVSHLASPFPGADAAHNLARLRTAPLEFFIALKNSLTIYADTYLKGFLGILGSHDVYLPTWTYVLSGTLLAVSMSLNPAARMPRMAARAAVLLVAIATAVLAAVAIYVTFPQSSPRLVDGLQGRYFLPVAAVAILATCFDARLWSRWKIWRVVIPCGAAISLIVSVTAVGAKYYLADPLPNFEAARPYEGKLIRCDCGVGTQAGWFFVVNGYRRYIADAGWVREQGIDSSSILVLPEADFNAIAEYPEPLRSGTISAARYEGKLVRRSTPGMGKQAGWYLVSQGKRQWIMDARWLTDHGFAPQDVLAIPDSEFDAMPENPEPLTAGGARRP